SPINLTEVDQESTVRNHCHRHTPAVLLRLSDRSLDGLGGLLEIDAGLPVSGRWHGHFGLRGRGKQNAGGSRDYEFTHSSPPQSFRRFCAQVVFCSRRIVCRPLGGYGIICGSRTRDHVSMRPFQDVNARGAFSTYIRATTRRTRMFTFRKKVEMPTAAEALP